MSELRIESPHGHMDLPGSVFYFGVISDLPFVAAALRNDSTTDPGDRIGFDDFTVAVVRALAGAGLRGLGLARSGRRPPVRPEPALTPAREELPRVARSTSAVVIGR
jgi:hypothetical protein